MQTTYEAALDEFRDASAAVRQAFGKVSEARELQIIADSQHKTASNTLAEAQTRLDRADAALSVARAAPVVETAAGIATQPAPVSALFYDAKPNGAVVDAEAAGIGIG